MSLVLGWSIVKKFARENRYGFTLDEVANDFPKLKRIYLTRLFSDMISHGMLIRISRNHYCIVPLDSDPNSYLPDKYLIAKYLMRDQEYYIAYTSALNLHGLCRTDNSGLSENVIQVVTARQFRPSKRNIGPYTYHFIHLEKAHFFGIDPFWVDSLEQARASDLEKTLVDIASHPRNGGGLAVLANALILVEKRINHDKIFHYLSRNNNSAAKKRYLFLTQKLGMEWTIDHDRMMSELGSGVSLLDPASGNKGKINGRFGLKINMDLDAPGGP